MLSWQSSLQCCVNCNCSISLSLLSHVIVKQRMSCKEYLWQILNVNNCTNCFLWRYNTSSTKIMKTWSLQFSSSYLELVHVVVFFWTEHCTFEMSCYVDVTKWLKSEHQHFTSIHFTHFHASYQSTLLIFLFIFVADNKPMRKAACYLLKSYFTEDDRELMMI